MRSSPGERQRPTSSTATIHPRTASEDERRIQRQALAGLLWSKQSYLFDVNTMARRAMIRAFPPPESRRT